MAISSLPLGDGSGDWGPATARFVDDVADGDVFSSDWARQQQARLFDVDRKVREWATTTALLTATASTTWPDSSDSIPPVVHLKQGIVSTRDARLKSLSRLLSGRKWRALRTFGVGTNGYLHRHTAVYIAGDVDASAFGPWISAHTGGSPLADTAAHQGGTVEVRDIEADDRGLVGYIMENTPGLDTRSDREHGIKCAPTAQQRGAVVLDRADVSPLTFGYCNK